MPRLCCFVHPELTNDQSRSLNDVCPRCGRQYGFPILTAPAQISQYKVIKPIDRGFYSAAYVVESGPFNRRKVLKLAFKSTYDFFSKDFAQECRDHSKIAEGSDHIVGIDDMKLDIPVAFGEETFICHLAELDYVDGSTLSSILESTSSIAAKTAAQIAIDLFAILRDLQNKSYRHNDLQPANLILERLTPTNRRADAEDDMVRLVAIDLNSASDKSRSDSESERLGDLHWVVKYLKMLVTRLLPHPDRTSDLEYRLASILDERAFLLSPDSTSQRIPTFDQCIEDIRSAVRQVSSPWMETPKLRRFNDAYNAQTLAAWFVPYLIVDPENSWLSAISTPGPQVITGMRGCGKTMLLRALQFHARATIPDSGSTSAKALLNRLENDRYVGLYASSTRLLDTLGTRAGVLQAPYVRLFVQYAIEAIRAIRHLREVDMSCVQPSVFGHIGRSVASYVLGAEDAGVATSEYQLERILLEVMVRVSRGDKTFEFHGHPSAAFPALADAIREASSIWSNATVLYLLDDVSTRYLEKPGIEQLMSALLFSDPRCAFKLTTEAQTLEMILRSPGQIERAREGRDYHVFDLGAEVNGLIRSKGGLKFIGQVLAQRSKYYALHPQGVAPATVLGDVSLESIADRIATTTENSRHRKSVYHGVSALAGVCVGDIGDVISLYELILRRSGDEIPVKASIQSECYQEYCSRRLYDLNRRDSARKDHALAFADASHKLLMKSERDFVAEKVKTRRLRQYLKLYVRVTTGDTERQFKQLRELIDAGVFVLDGGAQRTKTRDTNPIQQFKLSYRKLYGLSKYIGLSERDRFELSGDDLIRWLDEPANGKEILLRNLASDEDLVDVAEFESSDPPTEGVTEQLHSEINIVPDGLASTQLPLQFDNRMTSSTDTIEANVNTLLAQKIPTVESWPKEKMIDERIDTVVLGLGFEDRTLESSRRLRECLRPKSAVLVRYKQPGKGSLIRESLWPTLEKCVEIDYSDIIKNGIQMPSGNTLVDITGLAKPAIFHSIRTAFGQNGSVWVWRTEADSYYPLDEDIEEVLNAEQRQDSNTLLASLSKVLTGEIGPYTVDPLMVANSDDSRRRLLIAFTSPKHERVLKLLDDRAYDAALIVTYRDNTPRARMARIAADILARNYSGTHVEEFSSDDLQGVMNYMVHSYHEWYVDQGFNCELGLTGSKIQAVACAIVSASMKISQCWYVRPAEFDPERFTKGVGETTVFRITRS